MLRSTGSRAEGGVKSSWQRLTVNSDEEWPYYLGTGSRTIWTLLAIWLGNTLLALSINDLVTWYRPKVTRLGFEVFFLLSPGSTHSWKCKVTLLPSPFQNISNGIALVDWLPDLTVLSFFWLSVRPWMGQVLFPYSSWLAGQGSNKMKITFLQQMWPSKFVQFFFFF